MTPERWARVKIILDEALQAPESQRQQVLDSNCGGDSELRAAVERLLAGDAGPGSPGPAANLFPVGGAIAAGDTVEHYRIESKLGEGGMGVVYRAYDTKLNRPVAVKFLSAELADAAARGRFQREARMASSLNHPHILTVYDAGEYRRRQYLVTEFVDGGTLQDWAKAQKRTWRQIVDLLVGVADGLATAHEAGILHRDIKPANILVAKSGYAKLADFGLAKLADDRDRDITRTITENRTTTGAVIGTIAYMSPEQASGKPADARSDIFSFGVVLYELFAGRRPFTGANGLELLQTITRGTPAPLDVEILPALRNVVDKCLEADPADRYQTTRELVVDLRRAARHKVTEAVTAPPVTTRKSWWRWVAALALLAAGVGFWEAAHPAALLRNPLADATFTRLTDYDGAELDAAISPDGKFVSFLSDQSGTFNVWLTEIGAGKAIDLTPGSENQRGPLRSLGFTREGTEIWLAGTEKHKVRMLPLVGGEPRVFPGEKVVNPLWSPDGSRLAYHTLDAGDPIFVAERDGANPRQIFKDRPDLHNHYLVWGADGEWIYFVHGKAATAEMDLWRIRASGGDPERLTQQNSDMRDPTLLGQQTILYVARGSDGSAAAIWAFDIPHRSSRRITFGLETYTSLSASADGQRLAATVANPKVGLWTVPLLTGGIAAETDVKRLVLPSARSLTPRLRGEALYYLSSLGTGNGLWRFEGGKTVEVWRGSQGGILQAPAISPDGRRIAIVILKDGKRRLRLISADGGETNPLAPEIDVDGSADWSPDGNWIVAGGNDGKGDGLFKIPAAGGAPVRLAVKVARNPVWSPDGSLIAYSGQNVFTLTPLLAVRPDGSPVEMPPIRTLRDGERLRFLPDGKGLVYMEGGEGTSWQDFWLLDLKTMNTRRLTKLSDRAAMRTFDITPDGRQIVFDRLRENSAVVLIDLHAKR